MSSSSVRSGAAPLVAFIVLAATLALGSRPAARPSAMAVVGKSPRYCNPLPLETSSRDGSPQGVSLGDVTVVREGDAFYLFGTGGGAWVSSDFLKWKYQAVEVRGGRLPVAPHVAKYKGAFYMSGNSAPLYRAPNILGPFEVLGPWKNEKGEPWTGVSNGKPWTGAFDVDIFIDDNSKPYLYFPGRSTDGIYVAPLDPNDLTRFAAAPKHLFGFDKSHAWERWGDKNEYANVAWIEGPWAFKRNGIYYVEYSASGTQWLSYASGVYSAQSPLGPFTYSPRNPLLRKITGIVTGPGHGSVAQGPDGNWWVFYTIVMANPPGGRRIGMDPVDFDANGNMFTRGPSDTPQWAPGVVANPVRDGDSGSIPLTVNKLRAMNQRGGFSSQRPGHEAAYALDDSNGTWWEPAEDDAKPTLTIDLGAITEFESEQLFTVDSSRIEFTAGRGGFGASSGRAGGQQPGVQPATPQPASQRPTGSVAFRYKIEVSRDGQTFTTILDKTDNSVTRYTEFDEVPPTQCRYVRLIITDWPHIGNSPLGIMEFTVFGKAVETAKEPPQRAANPTYSSDGENER
jgi:xylan 1,4-beta-xylosidase